MDFTGPLYNHMFLVAIDAQSKWIEVFPMNNSTSFNTIQKLRTLFAQLGIPRTVVSDTGPCFKSDEFEYFLKGNGIYHCTSEPYHPSSNGLAERAVRVVKEGLRKVTKGTISDRLAKVLFSYRNSPHATTGVSPAELLFGRKLSSQLDLLKPSLESRVQHKQDQQKELHDRGSKVRSFSTGDRVYVRNFHQGDTWLPGTVATCAKSQSYEVTLTDDRRVRRHQDHIRLRTDSASDTVPTASSSTWTDTIVPTSNDSNTSAQVPRIEPTRRYPVREHRPPDRLRF